MTMAKPGLAQDQTVEEILASIRQVINGDQSRSAASRPATGVMQTPRDPAAAAAPPGGGNVTAIHGGKMVSSDGEVSEKEAAQAIPAGFDADEAAAPAGRSRMHDVVELAIEQALDGVDPDDTRAETAVSAAAKDRPPLRATMGVPATRRPVDQALRGAEPQPDREVSRPAAPQPAREALRTFEPAPRQPPQPAPATRSLLSARVNAAVTASFDDLTRALALNGSRNIDQTVEDLLRPMLKGWLEDNLPSLVERLVREEIERVSRGGR